VEDGVEGVVEGDKVGRVGRVDRVRLLDGRECKKA